MRDDPVATTSQHQQELAALDLIEHPTVKAAYRRVAETWLGRAKASEAMRERFDDLDVQAGCAQPEKAADHGRRQQEDGEGGRHGGVAG